MASSRFLLPPTPHTLILNSLTVSPMSIGGKERDVSIRLLRPTLPRIDFSHVLRFLNHSRGCTEANGSSSSSGCSPSQSPPILHIFDEGCAQYMLGGEESHHFFYAALIDDRAKTLRCRTLAKEPPNPLEDEAGNTFEVCGRIWCPTLVCLPSFRLLHAVVMS